MMMSGDWLTEREQQVLEAVIRTYVDTAEPAGSRTIVKRFSMGISPATVRNTMSDLEEKGYLFHPHTSAGRVPTDRAYRFYVNTLMRPAPLTPAEEVRLQQELAESENTALERMIRRSVQVLGLLTAELGIAMVPRLEEARLEKLELLSISSEKVLMVLTLAGGVVRTVYVDLPGRVPAEALIPVMVVLNERLAGRTLAEIRRTLPQRLRDSIASDDAGARDLLNIFLQSAEEAFEAQESLGEDVHVGRTSVLATQPEFASGVRLRSLLELTEQREILASVLGARAHDTTMKITIGAEHDRPELMEFTLVTSEYRIGGLAGVVGVIGPTRMPYERVVAIVGATSSLLTHILGDSESPQQPVA
jgi:heat-inducible transcriptional repressor